MKVKRRMTMILLKKENYNMVTEPLKKVNFNNLFARSVIEGHISGSVYVDDVNNSKTFHVVHPYGMSLLFGDCYNEEFNARFRDYSLNIGQLRNKHEWMQVYPDIWNIKLNDLFKGFLIKWSDNSENIENNIIELNTRVNFKFNLNNYLEFKQNNIKKDLKIVRTDGKIFTDMNGSVIPSNFWETKEDFEENGIGFSLFYKNKLATTAFSSCIHDNKLELGMETIEKYKGKGFAQHACSALIDYCIENDYEPIWACRLQNIGSYKLAIKLGFKPTKRHRYYRLSN